MRADRTNWGNRKMYKWKKDAKALLFTVNTEGSESRLRWERGEGKQNRKILLDKSSTFTKTVAFFFFRMAGRQALGQSLAESWVYSIF